MMARRAAAVALVAIVTATPTAAQTPAGETREPVRGTVEKLAGHELVVKTRAGPVVTVLLADDLAVNGVARRSLSDVKPGEWVASTTVKGTDGRLHAIEIHLFPPGMRPTEGQRPSSLVPGGLMTNAKLVGVAEADFGRAALVGEIKHPAICVVAPDTPIVTYVAGDAGLLKPGASVTILAVKKPDGTLTAARVTAEKDGVKPPM